SDGDAGSQGFFFRDGQIGSPSLFGDAGPAFLAATQTQSVVSSSLLPVGSSCTNPSQCASRLCAAGTCAEPNCAPDVCVQGWCIPIDGGTDAGEPPDSGAATDGGSVSDGGATIDGGTGSDGGNAGN